MRNKGIIIFATKNAKKKYKEKKNKKDYCPSCEIKNISNDVITEETLKD